MQPQVYVRAHWGGLSTDPAAPVGIYVVIGNCRSQSDAQGRLLCTTHVFNRHKMPEKSIVQLEVGGGIKAQYVARAGPASWFRL